MRTLMNYLQNSKSLSVINNYDETCCRRDQRGYSGCISGRIRWVDILSSSNVGGLSYALSRSVPFGGREAN